MRRWHSSVSLLSTILRPDFTRPRHLSSIAILVRAETLKCITRYFLNRCVTCKVTLCVNAWHFWEWIIRLPMLKKEYIYSIIIFPWFFNFVIDEGCGLKRNSSSGFEMSFLKERRRLAAENECWFFLAKHVLYKIRTIKYNLFHFWSHCALWCTIN